MVLSQYDIVSDQVFWKDFTESTDFFLVCFLNKIISRLAQKNSANKKKTDSWFLCVFDNFAGLRNRY